MILYARMRRLNPFKTSFADGVAPPQVQYTCIMTEHARARNRTLADGVGVLRANNYNTDTHKGGFKKEQ